MGHLYILNQAGVEALQIWRPAWRYNGYEAAIINRVLNLISSTLCKQATLNYRICQQPAVAPNRHINQSRRLLTMPPTPKLQSIVPILSNSVSIVLNQPLSKRLKSSLRQESLPLYHFAPKLDQENSLSGPHLALSDSMCRHPSGEVCAVTYPFHDSSHKSGAIQLAHLAGYANVLVDERLVVDNHVLIRLLCIRRLLQPVRLSAEEMLPYVLFDEVEEGNYVLGPQLRPNGLTVEKEIEELDAYGVALNVKSRVCHDSISFHHRLVWEV